MKVQNHWAIRLKLGLVLAGVISLIPAGVGMSHERHTNHNRLQEDSSVRTARRVKRKHDRKTSRTARRGGRGTTHSIIFVGGKRTGSKKSNPTQAKKVQGALNPQPIPPGKQRQP